MKLTKYHYKIFILDDEIHTLAYFHKDSRKNRIKL